ncbi:MAG: YidC/Oxa1 family membrane protein insertase [Candidatus Paceibacterota bacterium]|jgi:YidC/Oxa1 family membrane protein insertase
MNFFIDAFYTILYEPLFNILVLLYEYIPGRDFGVAVIVLTLIIRFLLYPLMMKSIRSQKIMAELQPKIKEIQEKYKDDKEKQTKEMMDLYKREKFNPFGGCLPLLLQLPILLALYRVFWSGLTDGAMTHLYSFVPNPGVIDPFFLGILDLSAPNTVMAVIAGVAQFFQTKTMNKISAVSDNKNQLAGLMQKQMVYFFPIFTVIILFNLPSAIGLYWIITALFSVWQQKLVFKKNNDQGTVKTN